MKNFYKNQVIIDKGIVSVLNKNIRFDECISSIPVLFARSGIFTYKKRNLNAYIDESIVFESKDKRFKLLAAGAELNQTDFTNFLEVLNKAFNIAYDGGGLSLCDNIIVNMTQKEHVKLLSDKNITCKSIGKRNKNVLLNSTKRLAQKSLTIQVFKAKQKVPLQQITFSMFKKASVGSFGSTIEIDPLILYLFYNVTWIDSNFRKSIKSDFTKALYSFICTNINNNYKDSSYAYISIDELMKILASDCTKYKFVNQLKLSLSELANIDVIYHGFTCGVKCGLKYRKLTNLPSIKGKRRADADCKEYIIKTGTIDTSEDDCVPF